MRPDAELDFLRRCCDYPAYNPDGQTAATKRLAATVAHPFPKFSGSATTTFTGLPREHPLEAVHKRMRPFFDRVFVPHLMGEFYRSRAIRDRDIFVAAVAKLLPAVTAITLDPYLHEQIIYPPEDHLVQFAIEGAWQTTLV